MAFEKPVPVWNAPGTEPPASLKNSGFQPGYKPPAAYFNWFWHATSEALKELQEKNGGYIGQNPITTPENDTPSNWSALGTGYALYGTTKLLIDQPSEYGIVVNYVVSTEVFQIWNAQAGGPTYFRSGNASGWINTWRKIYDTVNKPTTYEIGAAPESMTGRTYSVATYAELIGALDSVLSSTPSHTSKQFEVSFTGYIEPFGGGTYLAHMYKVGDDYATAELRVYGTDAPKIWICSRYDGRWLDWTYLSDSAHTHAASGVTAGMLGGRVMANADASGNLENAQVRNINAGTGDLTAGSSSLGSGSIYVVYE